MNDFVPGSKSNGCAAAPPPTLLLNCLRSPSVLDLPFRSLRCSSSSERVLCWEASAAPMGGGRLLMGEGGKELGLESSRRDSERWVETDLAEPELMDPEPREKINRLKGL